MSLALTCEAVRYSVTRLPLLLGAKAMRDATIIEKRRVSKIESVGFRCCRMQRKRSAKVV